MIQIIYKTGTHTVSLRGHANGGKVGHDLVCASASILVHTLASFVQKMEETGELENSKIHLFSGNATIGCTPTRRSEADVKRIFGSICEGFALLARNYPENISFVTQ